MINYDDRYWSFKLDFRKKYKTHYSIYADKKFYEQLKQWWTLNKISNNSELHYNASLGHILIGTNDKCDNIKIKMSYGGKIKK